MNTIDIKGTSRTSTGRKFNNKLRTSANIPAVLYGGGDNLHFHVKALDVRSAVYTSDFNVINLEIDGTNHKCIVKDIQFHPVTDRIEHMDFLRMIDGTPIKVELPVKFEGVSPGIAEGGKLQVKIRKVKVKALPENLVPYLVADISKLALGHSIRTNELQVPDTIEILNPPAIPVGSIEVPRALKSADAAEEEGAEGTEGAEGAEAGTEV